MPFDEPGHQLRSGPPDLSHDLERDRHRLPRLSRPRTAPCRVGRRTSARPRQPAAVQGAKRRSEPLTARTDLQSSVARERGFKKTKPGDPETWNDNILYPWRKVAFGTLVQLVLEGKPQARIDDVLTFSTAVGLPMTLGEVGLAEIETELLDQVAVRATAEGEAIHNEPFEVRPDMVADAILAADALGRDWQGRSG